MKNFEVVLVCFIIGCLVQVIEPQGASNSEEGAVQDEIPPVPKLSILGNSDFDPENEDDKLNLETGQFSSRERRAESETEECGINRATSRFPVWPWMAGLILKKSSQSGYIDCGGSIINNRFVMTSAVCATNSKGMANEPDSLSVVLGLADRSGADHSQQFDIRAVHVHPMYNYTTFDSDIALLELQKPIEYSKWISPICLPTSISDVSKQESPGLGLGWGNNEGRRNSALKQNTIKEVRVVIQPTDTCRKNLGEKYAKYFSDRVICGVEESPYLCAGNSGGPVMQSEMDEDGQRVWTQVGIISFGIGCGPVEFYSRVDKHLPWIQSIAF